MFLSFIVSNLDMEQRKTNKNNVFNSLCSYHTPPHRIFTGFRGGGGGGVFTAQVGSTKKGFDRVSVTGR